MRKTRNHRASLGGLALGAVLLAGCAPAGDESPSEPSTPAPEITTAAPTSSSSGESPSDQWVEEFEEMALSEAGLAAQFWGSFGDPGGVAVVRNEDQRLPADEYSMAVHCEGPDEIVVSLETPSGDSVLEPAVLPCPASSTLAFDVADRGVAIVLDSGGEVGAYLVQIEHAGD